MTRSRDMVRSAQRLWISAGVCATLCLCLLAEELVLKPAGDQIHIGAPRLHFLTGRTLDRLHSGNAAPFDFQLSILAETKADVLRRSFERFVISYDLWEERFSVARMRTKQSQASHLSAEAAESWCIDNMAFATSGLPLDQALWVRLEVRVPDPKEAAPLISDAGMSLAVLVDLFSRASKTHQPQYWRAEAGPLRLSDLTRSRARGGD
jgi:hypothetical protein